ncbi:MAG: PEGA domain-containing protein [Pseudomonadota bacterium]
MWKKLIWLLLIGFSACSGGKTVIRSEPPTAFVTINGVPKGVTPLEIKLDCDETRKFKVVIVSPGYVPQTKTIHCRRFWGARKNILVELKPGQSPIKKELLSSPSTQEDFGTIEIKSIPSEADVFLNDTFIGTTPLNNQRIKSGNYSLEVRKQGFKPWSENVQITPRSNMEYSPILEEE